MMNTDSTISDAPMTNPVNHQVQVQVQVLQMKSMTDPPPVVELDEETNATDVGCDGYCRTAEAAVLETGTLLVGQLTRP
jgi:hypothetical protein